MKRILIVAAMEREVAGFIEGWTRRELTVQKRSVFLYLREKVAVVCGGIGSRASRLAADEAYKALNGEVSLMISAGVAGSLKQGVRVAQIIQPAEVIDEADSLTIRTTAGAGKLVSSAAVANEEIKDILARRFEADAVDMEAYAVADVARLHGVDFLAIKAISDEFDFAMPPLGRFVSDDGHFQTASFAAFVAIRPWLWPSVIALASNTAKAVVALRAALTDVVSRYSPAQDYSSAQYNR